MPQRLARSPPRSRRVPARASGRASVGSAEPPLGKVEPVLLGDEHADELAPPGQQPLERSLRLARERADLRANPLGEEGEDPGVEGVRLRQLPRRLGEVADLPGVDDGDGEPPCGEGCGRGVLVAARGFEDDEGDAGILKPLGESAVANGVVGFGPRVPAWTEGSVEAVLRDVDAYEGASVGSCSHRVLSDGSARPALRMRAHRCVAALATVRALAEGRLPC